MAATAARFRGGGGRGGGDHGGEGRGGGGLCGVGVAAAGSAGAAAAATGRVSYRLTEISGFELSDLNEIEVK